MVYRVFVEKKPGLAPEAAGMLADCRSFLGLEALENVRILNRYDVSGIDSELVDYARTTVFSFAGAAFISRNGVLASGTFT